ncbi:MAG TPA: hypothetical protein VFO11_02205, partial [Candidatus Polarisedimenticolaceae bacterium]|nr:hypothetical protein [Candidatus Polarisedimenticolaceae bacterium]
MIEGQYRNQSAAGPLRKTGRAGRVAGLLACIAASWGLATLAGRAMVRMIYEGRAPAFLNALMTRNEGQPVSDFYGLSDTTVFGVHFFLLMVALIWITRTRRSPWLWFALFVAADAGFVLIDAASNS